MSTEPMSIEKTKHLLEALVDRMSLSVVLEALAEVCHEKAEHLRSEWQDSLTASWWDDKGNRIERVRGKADA